MGRTIEDKQAIVTELKQSLSESQLALVIDYQGLTVSEITDLRRRLRPTGTVCKVAKNTLMGIAIDGQDNWQPMTELLKGSSAFLLVKDDFTGAIKAYQDFQKTSKKTELRGGVMEGHLLNEADVKALGELPSKEQLMAQLAMAINVLIARIAVGINEVPTSLARGFKAVAGKNSQQQKIISSESKYFLPDGREKTVPQTCIDFPSECFLEHEVNLKIQLTGYKIPKLTQLTLDVPITASSFNTPYTCRKLVLSASGNSEEITFPLVPLERGEQEIQVEFFLESARVGYYLVKTNVVEHL